VSIGEDELEGLRPFSSRPEVLTEGGSEFVFIPGLKVTVGDAFRVVDGLLCPRQMHGYPTRLYLSAAIPGKGSNWNSYMFFGRTWHTPSWRGVDAALSLPQMLRAHLEIYR
jgi:hypothetical protein